MSLHHLSQITPQIFVTSWWTAKNYEKLKEAGITHVLSLCQNGDKVEQSHREFIKQSTDNPLAESDLIYKSITHWTDIPNEEEVATFKSIIPECLDFIHSTLYQNQENKILIHCQSGRSRSVSITTVYFMSVFYSVQRNHKKVDLIRQGKRLMASPNYRKCQKI